MTIDSLSLVANAKPRTSMTVAVVLWLTVCSAQQVALAAGNPAVLWVSNPVGPNQTALVWGDSLGAIAAVTLSGSTSETHPV